jgi:hypothetical protein
LGRILAKLGEMRREEAKLLKRIFYYFTKKIKDEKAG